MATVAATASGIWRATSRSQRPASLPTDGVRPSSGTRMTQGESPGSEAGPAVKNVQGSWGEGPRPGPDHPATVPRAPAPTAQQRPSGPASLPGLSPWVILVPDDGLTPSVGSEAGRCDREVARQMPDAVAATVAILKRESLHLSRSWTIR